MSDVIHPLAYVVMAITGVGTVWGIITTARNLPPGRAQLGWAVLAELITLVQSVIAFIGLAGGFRPAEFATTIGYLIGILVLLPLAAAWALSDRSRFSGAVLAVAQFGVLAMTARLLILWVSRG